MAETLTKTQRAEYEDRAWDLSIKGWDAPKIAAFLAKPEKDGGLDITLSRQSVWNALQRIEARTLKQLKDKVENQKARQHMRLEYIYGEASGGWDRSQQAAIQEKAKGVASKPGPSEKKKADGDDADAATLDTDPEAVDDGYYLDPKTGEEIPEEERAKRVLLKALETARKEVKGASAEALFGLVEQTITTKYQGGDPRFLSEMRGALADQRKLWGLDAPTKQEITGENGGPMQFAFAEALGRVYGDDKTPAPPLPDFGGAADLSDLDNLDNLDDAESDADPSPYPV